MEARVERVVLPATEVTMSDTLQHTLAQRQLSPDAVRNELMSKYANGDWGDISSEQRTINVTAIMVGRGIVKGVYPVADLGDVWVLTGLNEYRGVEPTTYIIL